MPNVKSLGTVIAKLEELFQLFNNRFYSGKLDQPVITVSPDTTSGAYGWCTGWKAWKSDSESEDEGYYEINICAEYLKRPFPEICETLLHEMVHLHNLYEGMKDTSRGGTYHNKLYKAAAEEHGLKVDKDSKYGWTLTSLNDEAAIYIASLNQNTFDFQRSKIPAFMKKGSGKGSSSRKYVCPLCGCIIRATKEVNVVCGDCDVLFELDEG